MKLLRAVRFAVLSVAVLETPAGIAQQPVRTTTSAPIAALLARANQLTASEKPDLAAQAWRQVLLADPENAPALEGLVAYYARRRDPQAASVMLQRLRAAYPADPMLASLEHAIANGPPLERAVAAFPPTQDARLQRAEEFSRRGDDLEAFRIYRSVFGDHPPRTWAVPYYRAQAATPETRRAAALALGKLAQQYPNDAALSIAWAQILTLDPAKRAQGTQVLARYASSNPEADRDLVQALSWGVESPAMAQQISAYLAHHSDPSLASAFAHAQYLRRGHAQTAAAYRALQQKDTALAEGKFRQVLAQRPNDGPAAAGMGFVALQRQEFSSAVRWLELAERHGDRDGGVHSALLTARFWQCMAASQSAMTDHDPQQAEAQLHTALQLQPESSVAILALARLLAATGRQAQALPLFRELALRGGGRGPGSRNDAPAPPDAVEAWSGWLATSTGLRDSADALAAYRDLSPEAKEQLSASPTFLAGLAQAYLATGQRSRAEEVLLRGAQLPSAASGPPQRLQFLLQYAALRSDDGQYDSAQQAYRDVLTSSSPQVDPDMNVERSAWQGLVLIEHREGRDAAGLQLWKRAPSAVRRGSMDDVSFLLLLAAMQQSQKDYSSAQALLQQAQLKLQKESASPSLAWLRQSAALDLDLHRPDAAMGLYKTVLVRTPDDIAAWIGLLRAYSDAGQYRQAIATGNAMPEALRARLRNDTAYFQDHAATYFRTMASSEQALGHPQAALDWLQQMDAVAGSHHMQVPADMQLQQAWLQYDLRQDDASFANLRLLRKRLSADHSATADQQEQMAELSANLAVRRATRLAKSGHRPQALQVLDTASDTVGNLTVPRLRLAAGYLAAGAPATAVAIYQSVGLRQATSADKRAAIGAAMQCKQEDLAQAWLQQGLAERPHDAGLLLLAGTFEHSKGRDAVAKNYLRAALAASSSVPASDPGNVAANGNGASPAPARQTLAEADQIHRKAAELLASIRASHSGWIGGTPYLSHILGTPGTTQLSDVEVPVEISLPISGRVRSTAVIRTAYLDSGHFYPNPALPLGTLPPSASADSAPATGVGGSLQFATRSFAASIGATPAGFPVENFTAAASLRGPHNPWSVSFVRDSIRESQLSYAGLHDPAQPARVWGGTIANLATLQYALGNSHAGWYVNAGGGAVTGKHVALNSQVTGDAGAYWQIGSRGPSSVAKSLKLGINFYAQHNAHNELFFTYGHGGYFSPQYYLLPAVPLTYTARPSARLHYELSGSLGMQILQQAAAANFPLDATLQAARGNPVYPAQFSLGVNYGAQAKVSYLKGRHWLLGAFFSANNASDYNQQIGGLSLRYLFREQHASTDHNSGWFPYSGLRPYRVP